MERLTHEADFGLEDWEETLFFVKSDPNGAYNILDIAKYQGNPEFDEILKHIALRLSSIENILGDDYDLDRLREFAEADREGRCVVLPRLEPGRGDPAGELGEPGPPGVPWSPGRHKTYNELIKWLRTASGSPGGVKMSNAAADALAGLQAENVYMRKLLHQYCSCKVCANAADPYGLHCKFGGCNGGGNGAVEEDRWQLRPQTRSQTR